MNMMKKKETKSPVPRYIPSAGGGGSVGGGAGTPGGADTQIQFNDGGAFAGDSGLTWNKTTKQLIVTSSDAAAVAIGSNGDTNPVVRIVANVANQATGLSITGRAAGSGVTLTALSSGSNENVIINPKGEGFIRTHRTAGGSGGFQSSDSSGNVGAWMFLSGTSGRLYTGYGGEFANYAGAAGSSNRYAAWYSNNFDANANFVIRWFSGSNIDSGSADTGFARPAAGVVRVSNGSTGAGSLIIGTSAGAIGTSGAGVLAFCLSTAPSSSPADVAQLYSADWNGAGTAALHVRNEEGHIIKLARVATYTPTNVTTDRSYDANATDINELADVVGTLIADLQTLGILG